MNFWTYILISYVLFITDGVMAQDGVTVQGDGTDYSEDINALVGSFMSNLVSDQCPVSDSQNHSKALLENAQGILSRITVYKELFKTYQQIQDTLAMVLKESTKLNQTKLIMDMIQNELQYLKYQCQYQDCSQLDKANPSGVYTIYPESKEPGVEVYCDMETDGGGWTVIQRRFDGTTSFDRRWTDYENGFGNKDGEYWLGNKYVHNITSSGKYELKVVLVDTTGKETYALYKTFSIGDSNSKYELSIGGYSGTAGDWMSQSNKMKFTTKDRDNDKNVRNCAANPMKGAWWHSDCSWSELNVNYAKKLRWELYKFVKSVMMIRKL